MVSQPASCYAAIKRIRALMEKEKIQIQSDRSIWLVAFVFPIMLLVLFGFGINLDPGSMNLQMDYPSNDKPFYPQLSPLIGSKAFLDVELGSTQELEMQIQTNRARAFLQIEKDYQVLVDGTDSNTANIFSGTITGVLKEDLQQQMLEKGITPNPAVSLLTRAWYNPELKTQWTLVPGSLAVILTLVATLLTSLVIAKEYEKGMIESLYVTPLSPIEMYIAKGAPYYILSFFVLVGSILFAMFLYQLPLRGSLVLFFLSALCFLFTAINMGLLISLSLRDQFLCSQIALMSAYMPSFMLSGFLFELSSMPWPIQFISHFVAARYFVPCLQVVFLGGDSIYLVLSNCMGLLLLGGLWSVLAYRQLHKRIEVS